MELSELSQSQKRMLLQIAERLRRQAEQLESLAHSGNPKRLAEACGMLHATETQLLWVRSESETDESEPELPTEHDVS